MKAVIVEIKNDHAAVLSDDGCIVTVKNNNYRIGQVIQMSTPKYRFTRKIAAITATAASFLILTGVGTWAYASPYTYVSLDVNPSVEFSVNRFDRVIHVKAVNDDGEEVIQDITLDNLKNKTIEDAVANTVDQISKLGYFDQNTEGGIVIAASSQNDEKADELAQDLKETAEDAADDDDSITVEAFSVGLERVQEARKLGVTPGKLNLVEKLKAAAGDSADINTEDWLSKPVKDIMKATKDYRKAADDETAIDDKTDKEDNTASIKASDKAKHNTASENAKNTKVNSAEKSKETIQDSSNNTNSKAKVSEGKSTVKKISSGNKASANNKKNNYKKKQTSVDKSNAGSNSLNSARSHSKEKAVSPKSNPAENNSSSQKLTDQTTASSSAEKSRKPNETANSSNSAGTEEKTQESTGGSSDINKDSDIKSSENSSSTHSDTGEKPSESSSNQGSSQDSSSGKGRN